MYYDRNRNTNNYRRNNTNRPETNNGRQQQQMRQPRVAGVANHSYSANSRSVTKDLPLRMVVNAKYVGAIIGQGGANIRQITKESKARCVVDVSRGIRDPTGILEKVINIYGPPENCSKACAKITEIVYQEAQNDATNQGKSVDPELKLRAHNNLVGRLIGKGGSTIKKIMDETSCTVFVSNTDNAPPAALPVVCYTNASIGGGNNSSSCMFVTTPSPQQRLPLKKRFFNRSISELNAFNMERTITVRGPMSNICLAEQKISAKLRQCWENDMLNAPYSMYAAHPFMNGVPPPFDAVEQYPAVGRHIAPSQQQQQQRPMAPSTANAYIPPGHQSHQPVLHPHHATSSYQQQPTANARSYHTKTAAPILAPAPSAGPPPPRPLPLMPSAPASRMGPTEVVHVWVPNNMVGALIGTKGVHIRNVMRLTGAHIRIEAAGRSDTDAASGEDPTNDAPANDRRRSSLSAADRRVTITGSDFQQYKAQFWIFQRACEQGYRFFDEVRLCSEIQVPSRMVGRIIGKGGQNVRELQRITGAQVKIPEDAVNPDNDQTTVQVIGNFNAAQAVQNRVRHLVNQSSSLAHQNRTLASASGDYQHRGVYMVNHNDVGLNE